MRPHDPPEPPSESEHAETQPAEVHRGPSDPSEQKHRQSVVVPVVREELVVDARPASGEAVTVEVVPGRRHESVDVPLVDEHIEVERVAVGRFVDRAEPPRSEGDDTIVPVYEEVLVVERRLRLKEEVHIRRRPVIRHEKHEVDLRTEEVRVRREEPRANPAG